MCTYCHKKVFNIKLIEDLIHAIKVLGSRFLFPSAGVNSTKQQPLKSTFGMIHLARGTAPGDTIPKLTLIYKP